MVVEVSEGAFTDLAESALVMPTNGHGRTGLSGSRHHGSRSCSRGRRINDSVKRKLLFEQFLKWLRVECNFFFLKYCMEW